MHLVNRKTKAVVLRATIVTLSFLVPAPAAEKGFFGSQVFPVLEKANCKTCHNVNGVASPTRLRFPEELHSAERIEAFGITLAPLVDRTSPHKSPLLAKPTQRVPHAGGKKIEPGSPEEATLVAWIRHLAGVPKEEIAAAMRELEPAAEPRAALPVLRRLTHSQYNNTVRDLLHEPGAPANQFPPEDFVHGFKTQYQAQSIPPLLAEAYSAAAEKMARNAFRGGDTQGLIPCKPASAEDTPCRDKFLQRFGLRAFRRPLLDGELRRYSELFAEQAKQSGDFLKGAQIVVETMLQSPAFLFRIEDGSQPAWKPYETASRLSYLLWDSMPDDALLQDAANGRLDTPAGVEKTARRMLGDAKARQGVEEFVSQWLRFDRVLSGVKDRRLFPQFTMELAIAMTEETRRLTEDLVWNRRNFMDLFNAGYTFLNTDLANLYKLPPPEGEFDRVEYPGESRRAGILGHGSFLALTSKPGDTSPTSRGLFVREQFLCQEVPQPPPGVNSNLPPMSAEKPKTNRDRLMEHLTNESCASCHRLMDPIGYGFEQFDAVGGFREKLELTFFPGRRERNKQPVKAVLDLDTSGSIAGLPGAQFASPKELGNVLASSPVCQECVVKQVFRYAAGRMETPADAPLIGRMMDAFRSSQFQFQELLVAMVKFLQFPPGRS